MVWRAAFFVNGISYVAVVGALMLVRFNDQDSVAKTRPAKSKGYIWRELMDGFRYVSRRPKSLYVAFDFRLHESLWRTICDDDAAFCARRDGL
ncbi:MAG: hypothetical protein WKF84_17600 [Pyrinomonadaceae bacterium]